MLKIDKNSLERAAKETRGLNGLRNGLYVQLAYNPITGEVLHELHYDSTMSSRVKWLDKDAKNICDICSPMTADKIAEKIEFVLSFEG